MSDPPTLIHTEECMRHPSWLVRGGKGPTCTCGLIATRLRAEITRLRALLDRDRLVVLLQNEGLGDGGELCSWRCSDKGRYPGPCPCVDALVDLIREESNDE